MQVVNENGLEFFDLKLKIVEGKINTDLYSKITNSFTYALPSTYYPYKNIRNAPKGIALRLQRACDNDEKYNHCFSEYQNYLIGRDYVTFVKNSLKRLVEWLEPKQKVWNNSKSGKKKIFFY